MSGRDSFRTTVIGLTGGVASGKNFVAEIFAKNGAVVFDADKEVHKLLEVDKSTISAIRKKFPQCFVEGKIERKILGKIVFSDEKKLRDLEKIIHPQVRRDYEKFVVKAKEEKKEIVVLNIPLLLETEHYKSDYIVAITAPVALRKKRFLARSKNSSAKVFDQIRAKQMSDVARKKRADFLIDNSGKRKEVIKRVKEIISALSN